MASGIDAANAWMRECRYVDGGGWRKFRDGFWEALTQRLRSCARSLFERVRLGSSSWGGLAAGQCQALIKRRFTFKL